LAFRLALCFSYYKKSMKSRRKNPDGEKPRPERKDIEVRRDLQDPEHGKDLSYLNEMPQMGGYEGVKAGAPPPKKKADKKSIADES
jgi:hypothetical protein